MCAPTVRVPASRNVLLVRTLARVRPGASNSIRQCGCVFVYACMRVAALECAVLSCLLHSMWEGLLRGRPSVVF